MSGFLYIHIPFCRRKCRYCDFLSFPYDASTAGRYLVALCGELKLKKDRAGVLRSVYIGGGTPTILPDELFRKLFECIRNTYVLASDAEITVEANPGTLDASTIDTMRSCGVNRLSIGVQSFHDDELKTLGRIHSSDDAQRSLALVRQSGIQNFSVDLMYGIPGQDAGSWLESLAKTAEFSPTHISAYELTPERNTPFFHLLRSKRLEMPGDEQILAMYSAGIEYLESRGYSQYEISNFAVRGYECRHNLNYWERGEYLGAGAGAHSFLHNVRSQNTCDIGEYIGLSSEGRIPGKESLRLTPKDSLRERLFLGLRTTQGVRLDKSALFPDDLTPLCRDMIDGGFLELSGGSLRLTRKGFPVSNSVIVKLFEKFGL